MFCQYVYMCTTYVPRAWKGPKTLHMHLKGRDNCFSLCWVLEIEPGSFHILYSVDTPQIYSPASGKLTHPASPSQVAGITGRQHHAHLPLRGFVLFCFFVFLRQGLSIYLCLASLEMRMLTLYF